MADYLFKRGHIGLSPLDPAALKDVKFRDVVKVKISTPRKLDFHKKLFALIKATFNNQSVHTSVESLREDLLILAGHSETTINFAKEKVVRAKSISLHKMDQAEFDNLYRTIKNKIWEVVLPTMTDNDRRDFERELLSYD